MDTWSDRQLSFMKAGGNDRAKEWMELYNVKESDMKNKYSSPAFEAYREKLKAVVENRKYVDPSPEEMAKRASPYGSRNGSPSVGNSMNSSSGLNSSRGGSEYGQMSRSSELQSAGSNRHQMQSSGGFGNGNGYSGNGGYGNSNSGSFQNGGSSANGHHRNGSASGSYGHSDGGQDMQSRFAGRTAIGSHDFESSGSTRSSPGPQGNGDDELMSALYDGWSRFSTGVKQVASTAAEKVSSGTLTDEVSQMASKVTTSQTWNYVASFFGGDEQEGQQGGQHGQQQGPGRGSFQSQSRDSRDPRQHRENFQEEGANGGSYGSEANEFGRGDPRGSRNQPNTYGGGAPGGHSSRPEHSRVVGEKQGLSSQSNDPVRRPQSHPARSANGWGGNTDDWDDWDNDSRKGAKANPHVSIAEDEVEVDDYKTSSKPPQSLAAPKPTRPAAHAAPVHDDIYDFQVGSKSSTPTTVSAPASTKPVAAGWDDWDDWGHGK